MEAWAHVPSRRHLRGEREPQELARRLPSAHHEAAAGLTARQAARAVKASAAASQAEEEEHV